MFPLITIFSDWALVALRLAFGLVALAHGWPKLRRLRGTAAWFTSVGFRPGWFWGTATALLEGIGGVGVVFGLGTRFVAALFVGQFLVIVAWKLARRARFVGDLELDLLVLAAAVALFVIGAGALSLDYLFFGAF